MKHLHDDDLVLYSDGEIRTAPTQAHLHVCRGCRDRLRALELDLARLSPPPGRLTATPAAPPSLPAQPAWWQRILRRLASVRRRLRG